MTTYQRERPCRKCGGHTFYLNGKHCQNCQMLNSKNYRQKVSTDPDYREKNKANTKRWYQANPDYVKAYNRARYEMRKEQQMVAA